MEGLLELMNRLQTKASARRLTPPRGYVTAIANSSWLEAELSALGPFGFFLLLGRRLLSRGAGDRGEHFAEQFRLVARSFLLFRSFSLAIIVLVEAASALHLGRLAVDQRHDGVIREQPAAAAIVVNDVAQAEIRHGVNSGRPIIAQEDL